MRVRSPAFLLLTASALALGACGEKKAEEASASAADEAAAPAQSTSAHEATGPGIDRAIAPGVAFTYAYNFILPAKAITGVQREHAQACARLGANRCRVTGMSYEQPRTGEVEARLDFLLAPDLAQVFASDAIGAVEKSEGKLDTAQVNGENAGQDIKLSQQDSAGIEAEVKRIDARLAGPGLTAAERAELQQQVISLREQLRGNAQDRRAKEQAIATTPVSFAYSSEGLIGGQDAFGKALGASWGSAQTALSFALVVAGLALPWIGLAALVLFGWRRLRRKPAPAAPVQSD